MAILDRFGDIIKANINVILDKMEDPSKMIDQYLNDMMEDLAEVKRGTAGVMAEETRTKRMVDENQAEIEKYTALAKKALSANNEGDARVFITKKQELETLATGLQTAYDAAHANAEKMRQMHDKLIADIETLKSRREMIKAKVAVAKTQEKINTLSSATQRTQGAMQAFERMEDKADRMLDQANAMAELNNGPIDDAKTLEEKYASTGTASVEEELNRMKRELGL
ncbi:MAG: PspA/IM30 family protein [Dehalobacterium sp.]|jgi:phage shock protein A